MNGAIQARLNGKATPSILAIEVWLVRLNVGWAINKIPYHFSDSCTWPDIGRLTVAWFEN